VTKPADNCGVAALHLPFPVTLPHIDIQPIEIDLYIQSQTSCATSFPLPLGCGIDDNRPFVDQGSLDPHADPSRNRVHVILDFNAGLGTFTISPSCRIHPIGGAGFDNQKECFAPKQLNEGTSLSVTKDLTNPQSWVITISSVVVQTNYPAVVGPVEPGQVHNDWTLKIDPASGSYTLTGSGSAFPDFAVISDNHVECAAQGTNLTRLGGGPNRDYTNCAGLAPLLHQTPTASPSPSPTAVCPSQVFQSLVLAKYGPAARAAGKATCAGTYALQDFTPYAGGQEAQFFFKQDVSGHWTIIEGGNAVPTIACSTIPVAVLTKLGAQCPAVALTPTTSASPSVLIKLKAGTFDGIEPVEIDFSADGSNSVYGIHWAPWSPDGYALGTGTSHGSCVPASACNFPVKLTLTNPVNGYFLDIKEVSGGDTFYFVDAPGHPWPYNATAGTPVSSPSTPASRPGPTTSASPWSVVSAYYADVNAGNYRAAWALMSSGWKATQGSYAHWKAGYAGSNDGHVSEVLQQGNYVTVTVTVPGQRAYHGWYQVDGGKITTAYLQH
jgi:hypothetical protein